MVIFVGDRPGPRMKRDAKPFEGAACESRLKGWIKTIAPYDFIILNRGDKPFSFFKRAEKNGASLIALGNEASKTLRGINHFKLPHPSGRNRQINDEKFVGNALKECRQYIARATEVAILEATSSATHNATSNATLNATLNATSNATYNATSNATIDATYNATHNATRNATSNATNDATYDAIDGIINDILEET